MSTRHPAQSSLALDARMTASSATDVVVVGDGLIGLATAVALAEGGASVCLVGAARAGQASHAAAGMLAPSVERSTGAAHDFALRARDGYADFVAGLVERSGHPVSINERGVLQLALDEAGGAALRERIPAGSRWLSADELARLEPALAHAAGALHHPHDGAVDNRALLTALDRLARRERRMTRAGKAGAALVWDGDRPGIRLEDGTVIVGERLVLAAGAWTPRLDGLPRPLPVEPVRGQLLSVSGSPLDHVVYGPGGYLVPRGGRTVVGSTMERVDFDASTTADGLARVRATGDRICPALAGAPVHERWAGLRPVTPDGLPILGADPDRPALLYACGHSRNGILLGPLTAACITALVLGEAAPADISPFSVTRFAAAPAVTDAPGGGASAAG